MRVSLKYWIFVTNKATWKTVRDKNIWGSDTNTVKKIRKGDKAVVYVMQTKKGDESIPPRIKGAYEVVSEPYEDHSRIFKGRTYPNRVKLKPSILLEKEFVNFRNLVSDLNFIKNKRVWSGHLRSGINDMPKEDYNLIKKKLEDKRGK